MTGSSAIGDSLTVESTQNRVNKSHTQVRGSNRRDQYDWMPNHSLAHHSEG